jgi:uncharacterized protein (TIGR02996 family)
MHDEDGFLAVIRQTPADDTARLVYADWLDEQDDRACKLKAEFIRLELRLANGPYSFGLSYHLQVIAEQIDSDWLVVISRPKIEGCPEQLANGCPSDWSRLSPTSHPSARTCAVCRTAVHYTRSRAEAQQYLLLGQRTAVARVPSSPTGGQSPPRPSPVATVEREPLIERPRLPGPRDERCPDRQNLGDETQDESEPEESQSPRSGCEPVRRQ